MSTAAIGTYERLSKLSQRAINNPYKQQQLQYQQRLLSSALSASAAASSSSPSSVLPSALSGPHWQLGCWSREDPLKIMSVLYTLLRKYNFEWKVLSLYKLKARFPAGLVDRQGRPVGGSEVCKIGIQLYRSGASSSGSSADSLSSSIHSHGNSSGGGGGGNGDVNQRDVLHQLDVHKLYGQMFLFLDLTANLLTELSQQVHVW